MMDEPIWRQAIRDEQHPLHRAAWQLFSPSFNVRYSAETLAPQKDEVVAFANMILDTPELYEDSSLGSGSAPLNAAELLGEWQVTATIQRLVQTIEAGDVDSDLFEVATMALHRMGTSVVEPLLDVARRATDDEVPFVVAEILSEAGKGDPRALDFLKKMFDEQHEYYDILDIAESLLACNPQAGISFIENRLQHRPYDKELRRTLQSYLKEAREGEFDDL
jgi:hypothetical protein